MIALEGILSRTRPLIERLNALSLRERTIIFGACVAVLFVAWQALLMDPLAARARAAEARIAETRRQLADLEALGAAASRDPAVAAAIRNRSLAQRLAALDAELNAAAQGYIAPEHMTQLLQALLREQHGLKLVSLENLPVESLARTRADDAGAAPPADDRGPFLHPVVIVAEGDYASINAYLRAIEGLPWRIHWRTVELSTLEYPVSRVRIEIGALSLSRHWMRV